MKNMSNATRGAIFMIIGVIFFLNTLGLFKESFNIAFRVLSILLVAYGFYIGDYLAIIQSLFSKK